jgi:NAD(P)-dependent dehydrogenase (short-subunit alcohol dehydrogenase family)
MGKLAGKVAVITGGSSGIGLATAKRFASEGARVFITGRRLPELERARDEIGDAATVVQTDVSSLPALDALYATVREQAGHIDVLVLNAAFGEFKSIEEITEEHFEATFNTNVRAAVFGLQKALPLLAPGASVIIVGSIAGSSGMQNFSVYGATKGALRAFVRSVILDLKGRDIRVNVLSPGNTSTPALDRLVPIDMQDQLLTSAIPMGRIGTSDEMARAALFLATEESSYVHGAELFVDGGLIQA